MRKQTLTFCLIILFAACKNKRKDTTPIDTISKLTFEKQQKIPDSTNITIGTNTQKQKLETLNEDALNKIYIPLKRSDSSFYLHADIKSDHRIFGYAQPNTNSEKMILFSVFTNEVQNNPFKCKYGAYYEVNMGNQNFRLKYNGKKDEFIIAELTDSLNKKRNIYFEKKWIEIE